MASRVDVANRALNRIGQGEISNLETDGSIEAQTCRLHFDAATRYVLVRHEWFSALKLLSLAEVSEDNPTSFQYVYAKPNDLVRPLSLYDVTSDYEYRMIGSRIYTNESPTKLLYVHVPSDFGQLSEHVSHLIVLRLAQLITPKLAQSVALEQTLMQEYLMVESAAKDLDGAIARNDDPRSDLISSPLWVDIA